MGCTIRIGNAVPDSSDWQWYCTVERVELPDAPRAAGDCNQGTNERWPSYTGWDDFARDTNLHAAFYGEESGLLLFHPGCAILTVEHAVQFEMALTAFRLRYPEAVPRFALKLEGEPFGEFIRRAHDAPTVGPHDGNLARLEWLVWWTKWAVTNCERPAMYNS